MKYTPDEVSKLLANRPNQPHYVKALIGKCVKAAVLAEREACAQVCEAYALRTRGYLDDDMTAVKNATAIRARGQA